MKNCYLISIQDLNGRMQNYAVVTATMAAAISWAQTQAQTSNEPTSVSNITPQGINYIEP
jgi:hypothetical protein